MSARKVTAKAATKKDGVSAPAMKGRLTKATPVRRGRPSRKPAEGLAFEQKAAPELPPSGRKSVKGDRFVCEVCGLAVIVDEACGCGTCQIMCCGEPMKPKAAHRAAFPLLP